MTATSRTVAVTVGMVAASLVAAAPASADDSPGAVVVQDSLRDLQPASAGALDGAEATLTLASHDGRTTAVLTVRGIDRAAAGHQYGAHLHVGACVAGDGAAAGPHYNADVAAGQLPPRIGPDTEVWLDFVVTRGGTGYAVTEVPFVPAPGNRAVVVHRDSTDGNGVAGPRLACLPVSW
jgi:hypothetical protein